jgi:putative peptidoglycan lipid II flippase
MVKRLFSTSQQLLSRQQSNILSAAVVITGSSLLSAVLGLLRNRLLVERFFSTPPLREQLDAYWVAFRLPEMAFQLLVIGAVSAALIPVFSKYYKKSADEGHLVANSMLNLVLLLYALASIVIFVFAEQFIDLITSENFSLAQIELAAQLTRVMLVAQFFFAISNFISGMIQSHQRFLVPALSPLAYNLGVIGGIILLTPSMGIYGPAVGVVLGALLHLLMQLPLAYRLGYRYSAVLEFKHAGVVEMIKLIPPRTLSIAVGQIELMISVYFATALTSGSLTIMNLAVQLMTAPTRIFAVPLGQASLPFLSEQTASGDIKRFTSTVHTSLQHIFFLAFPAGMLLLILRIPLVRIAYGSSEFPWPATLLTGKAVAILSIALFAQGGIHLLIRAFYALHDTMRPFLIAVVAVVTNISLSYLGVYVFKTGVMGLAAAVSISTVVQFGLLFVVLLRNLTDWKISTVAKPTLKILLAAIIMAIFLWVPMRLLDQFVFDTTRTIPLIMLTAVAAVIGSGMYLALAKLLRIPEYEAYIQLIKRLGNWQSVLHESAEVVEEPPSQTQEMTPY